MTDPGRGRRSGGGRDRRGPDGRRRALDQQRSGFFAATVTAVRSGLGHCPALAIRRSLPPVIINTAMNNRSLSTTVL